MQLIDKKVKNNKMSLYSDLKELFTNFNLINFLSKSEANSHYKHTIFGSFWNNITFVVKVTILTLVFSQVLKKPLGEYLPYLLLGILLWNILSDLIMSGITLFSRYGSYMLQFPHSFSIYITANVFKILRLSALNILMSIFIVVIFVDIPIENFFFAALGFFIIIFTGFFFTYSFGIAGIIFPDIRHATHSILTIGFVVSPVLWPQKIIEGSPILIYNPFYHFMNIVREPLLGHEIPYLSFVVCLAFLILSIILASIILSKIGKRVMLWI